jgi:hypothetical protein
MSEPLYLNRLVVRREGVARAGTGPAAVVLSAGSAEREVVVGRVVPLAGVERQRDRRRVAPGWGYVRGDAGAVQGSYHSRREAAESCAVEAMDGPAARRCFDRERWERRRPMDN